MYRRRLFPRTCYLLGKWKPVKVFATFLLIVLGVLAVSRYWQNNVSSLPSIVKLKALNWTGLDHSSKTDCRFHTCFNINRCVFSLSDSIGVYVGEWCEFDGPASLAPSVVDISAEYVELVRAVRASHYHTGDPSNACVFVPQVDTLTRGQVKAKTVSVLLNSLLE